MIGLKILIKLKLSCFLIFFKLIKNFFMDDEMKCSCYEKSFILNHLRIEIFTESIEPKMCDECFWDILQGHIDKNKKQINEMKSLIDILSEFES